MVNSPRLRIVISILIAYFVICIIARLIEENLMTPRGKYQNPIREQSYRVILNRNNDIGNSLHGKSRIGK